MTRHLLLLCLAAAACSGDLPGPDPDTPVEMRVRVVTTGGDPDLDGYLVLVDGQPRGTISSTLLIEGLSQGSHQVALQGIATNCDLAGAPVRDVVLPSASFFHVSFEIACYATGIEVAIATTGIDAGTGYTVHVKDLGDHSLPINAILLIGRLPPIRHTVTLNLDPALTNCQVGGDGATREVDVPNRTVVPVSFNVTCVARFGAIQILLRASGADNDPGSYLASVDDGTPRRLSANGMVVFDSLPGGDHTVRISGGNDNCSLTGSSQAITSVPVGSLGRQYALVEFSASCVELVRRVAFTRYPFEAPYWGYDPVVAVIGETGGSPIHLTGGASPSWSPDGLRLAFVRITQGCYYGCQPSGIFLMNRDGTGLVELTSDLQDGSPAWSPNGAKIAFQRNGVLMVMNANGTSAAPVPNLQGVANGWDPDWSPDGTRLAFTCQVSATSDICVINTDGTGFLRLTSGSGEDQSPAWSRDGTRLLFSTTQFGGGTIDLGVMNADGTGVTRVTTGEAPSWSPDGIRIYFARSGALFSVQPDGSDLRPIIGNATGWNYAPVLRQ